MNLCRCWMIARPNLRWSIQKHVYSGLDLDTVFPGGSACPIDYCGNVKPSRYVTPLVPRRFVTITISAS